jgi:DNA-directed RNA polymerase specialized sigma24 family protein
MPRPDDPHAELLRRDPHRLLLEFQDPIRRAVLSFVSRGGFPANTIDDVIQSVNEHLLRRMPNIQKQFDGSVLVRTYLSQIVRNICLSLIRGKQFAREFQELSEEAELDGDPVTDRYSLDRGRVLLEAVLAQFGRHRAKLVLCLKLRFRIPMVTDDILAWSPVCDQLSMTTLLSSFGGDYRSLTEKEVFAIVTPIFNLIEGKQNTPDALRKWLSEKMEDIIELLNGHPPVRTFDEETVEILVQDRFSPFLMHE